jgi:signal transduction histidine kinase
MVGVLVGWLASRLGSEAKIAEARAGAGLGLFVARSIAEAHGGTLDVRSDPANGATFTIRLPIG